MTRRHAAGSEYNIAEAITMYEVIVGNIGTVYSGNDRAEADRTYAEYTDQSAKQYGRAAGEDVILTKNGEPIKEYSGTIARAQWAEEDAAAEQLAARGGRPDRPGNRAEDEMIDPNRAIWKVPPALRLLGSQPGQTPTVDDLVFVRTGPEADREIIVRDAEDLHYELWFRHAEGNPAGYSLQYAGRRYEYARRLTEQEVLDLP